jgi:predicted nucleic acid-binding protein
MILPESSIWIDYFNGRMTPKTELLEEVLAMGEALVGDLILSKVLQGFRNEAEFQRAKHLLTCLPFREILGQDIAWQSAQNYRLLRQRGITIHKTMNLIIGTFCIVNRIRLLQDDHEFLPMVEHLGLTVL